MLSPSAVTEKYSMGENDYFFALRHWLKKWATGRHGHQKTDTTNKNFNSGSGWVNIFPVVIGYGLSNQTVLLFDSKSDITGIHFSTGQVDTAFSYRGYRNISNGKTVNNRQVGAL